MPTLHHAGADLWYERHGRPGAVPLVFIHGLGSSGLDWEAQLPAFADHDVIAVDLRGHGRSARAGGAYSIAGFASDIAALMQALSLPPAHVVGISLGGAIAFQLALDQPARVRSLTVVNSGPRMVLETLAQRFAIWSRFAIIRLLGLPKLGEVVSKKLFPAPEHESLRRTFAERFRANDPDSYRKTLRALIGWSVQERLLELKGPVLILTADQDYTPVALKEAYVKLIPGARLEVIRDSHHALPMERPEAFNGALRAFVDAH